MSINRWRGRVALVTGASSGIGAAIASRLAGEVGMRVAVMARRAERLTELQEDIRALGGESLVCAGDVTNVDDIAVTFETIRSHWGGIDLLVNNAGIAAMAEISSADPKRWEATVATNVLAPANCMQAALEDLRTRDEGQIINISSMYAYHYQVPNFAMYQASKAAVVALTNSLRAEIATQGNTIRVGMISPGMVATEFRGQATDGKFAYESYFENYEPLVPEDITDAVLYMLSTKPHVQVQDILISPLGQGI